MATKAQQFRHEMERSGTKQGARLIKLHTRDPNHTMTLHVTKRGDKNASAALEDSESGRPSRKSTRPSSHHGRTDTKLAKAALEASMSPKAQATRAKTARH